MAIDFKGPDDDQSRDGMLNALKALVASSGQVTVSGKWLRAMFAGKKAAKEWAADNGLMIDKAPGAAIFKKAA